MTGRDIPALLAFIERRQRRSFGWRRGGDCVSFSLAGVKAQTGVDLLADIPRWRNLEQARAVAESLGGLEAAIDMRMDRVPAALAMRGDVAALPDSVFGVRLMLVEGHRLVGPGANGAGRSERDQMMFAWSAITARRVAVSNG